MIENRKEDHIRIAEGKEVNASHNYWDDITLIHRAIPEVNYDNIDTKVDFHGNRIDYPILIKKKIGRYYTMESQILLSDASIVSGELRKRL